MCGRFTLLLTWSQIHRLLDDFVKNLNAKTITQISAAPERYNIAPTQPILVLARGGENTKAHLMRWGLVPEWVDNPADFPLIINARSETLATKTSFKNSLKNQRCIIPCSGYYEWKRNSDGTKTPNYISRENGFPIFMAGVYSTWVGTEGEEVDTAAIVTIDANDELKKVHHRTPVVLAGHDIENWLDTANVNAKQAQKLLKPVANGALKFHPVSTAVNSPKNDRKDLIAPALEKTGANNITDKKPQSTKPAQLDLF